MPSLNLTPITSEDLSEALDSMRGGEFYSNEAVNRVLENALPSEAFLIPVDVTLEHEQDALRTMLEDFRDSDNQTLVMPIFVGGGHFTGLQVSRNNENGSFEAHYIDPLGSNAQDLGLLQRLAQTLFGGRQSENFISPVPHHIAAAIEDILDVPTQNIAITTNRLQHSLTNEYGISVATNNDCGAFVTEALISLANGNAIISQNRLMQRESLESENFVDVGDRSQDYSRMVGEGIREFQSQSLIESYPEQAAEIEMFIEFDNNQNSNSELIGAENDFGSDPTNRLRSNGNAPVRSLGVPLRDSKNPTSRPTGKPSSLPTTPSSQPSSQPSNPTSQPSEAPSRQPTAKPNRQPTAQPSGRPSMQPSTQPNMAPTTQPSTQPNVSPTVQPTSLPTRQPTRQPSRLPTYQPSEQPSNQPSNYPTVDPTAQPIVAPTFQPSAFPTRLPTSHPTFQPSRPTFLPTEEPTQPSSQPSSYPSSPSSQPSSYPSSPSSQPSSYPSSPSSQPSSVPSAPTYSPTLEPVGQHVTTTSSNPASYMPGNSAAERGTALAGFLVIALAIFNYKKIWSGIKSIAAPSSTPAPNSAERIGKGRDNGNSI